MPFGGRGSMFSKRIVSFMIISIGIIALIIGMAIWQDPGTGIGEGGELKKFSSAEELKAFLKEHAAGYQDDYGIVAGTGVREGLPLPPPAPGVDKSSLNLPLSESATSYSTTNIQVEGVDEADFLKNDGKYIYMIAGNRLLIIDAYPAEKARILSETKISGTPAEIFLKGDRVVVFSTVQGEVLVKPRQSAAPVPVRREMTHAFVYSVKDRSQPVLMSDINVSGHYYNSRMIGDFVYLITNEQIPWVLDEPLLPLVGEEADVSSVPAIYYYDAPQRSFVYYTVTSLDLNNGKRVSTESFLLGYSTTLYVSLDNLYIAYRKEAPGRIPSGPVPLRGEVGSDTKLEGTIIHRFGLHEGRIGYDGTGDVPGHLLNQFSMDEYGNHLRVATTVEGWSGGKGYLYNSVYVLNREMKRVGELEYIAPDERIYATRFMGDRLYMVTFKRIDPFFVIDLSDPGHPGILGELKIPGYSDYLHPYDSRYIIGIGKETEENAWGGVSIAGLKIALFDVSDLKNPRLIDRVEIGEAGTDSEALQDHRAFLFDREKNILVIPVREVKKVPIPSSRYGSYTQRIWQGAYVFSVSPDRGFSLRGRVTHNADAAPYMYWGSPSAVKRSLYMDDALYTISSWKIVMSDLREPEKTLNELEIPYRDVAEPYPEALAMTE